MRGYENNARLHSEKQIQEICDSIKTFGFNDPIELAKDNMILSGHGRLAAAVKLKMDEVPTITHDHLTETQKKAYILAANRIALSSTWDNDILKHEFLDLKDDDFDLSLTGFTDDEINMLLNCEELNEGLGDENAVGEVQEDPISKYGDVWILGEHRLMCGDSTLIDDVSKLMNQELCDLLITDPPYNVNYEGKTKDALKIENDSMGDTNFRQFLSDAFGCANMVLKAGGVFYIWHSSSESYNFFGACIDSGWKVRQQLIWLKNTLVMGRKDYHWKHEPCLYGWKDGEAHYWGTDRKQTSVIECDRPQRNELHPTMKPVELIEYQLKNSSRPKDLILDLFGGSGTTLIASEKIGRRCNLMELDPRYADVIVRRYIAFTGKEAILESTGESFNAEA